MKKRDQRKYELLKDLIEGHSKQSKTSNQFWLVLIIISIIGLTAEPNKKLFELPFTLGKVDLLNFNIILILLISTLILAFTSAMIQVIRTRLLIQKIIEKYSKKINFGIHIQDIIDSLLLPTFNRVSPISQILLGKHQFKGYENPNTTFKYISISFYIILKFFSFIIIYLIPVITLFKSWIIICSKEISCWYIFGLSIITILAMVSIVILIFEDIKYMIRAINENNR